MRRDERNEGRKIGWLKGRRDCCVTLGAADEEEQRDGREEREEQGGRGSRPSNYQRYGS